MENYYTTLYQAQLKKDKEKAQWFISELIKNGIPKSAIATNDFDANPIPRVYITIPYGKDRGGKSKGYQLWNSRTLEFALNWWFDKPIGYSNNKVAITES